jgi:mannitol-1-/sugar-/sorbitol-6-phosphatase
MEFICTAIIFDLDGVLVDSSAVVARHWQRWADRHGVSYADLADVMHGRTSAETIRIVAPDLDADEEGRIREAQEGIDTDGLEVYRGAGELLRSLPAQSWAVVTSGSPVTAATRLRFGGIPTPPVLVTAVDVERGKPDPEGFLLAAKRLDVRPEQCVVMEDSPVGIEAAKAAGMRRIAVATTHDPPALAQADVIAHEIADVRVESVESHLRVLVEPMRVG